MVCQRLGAGQLPSARPFLRDNHVCSFLHGQSGLFTGLRPTGPASGRLAGRQESSGTPKDRVLAIGGWSATCPKAQHQVPWPLNPSGLAGELACNMPHVNLKRMADRKGKSRATPSRGVNGAHEPFAQVSQVFSSKGCRISPPTVAPKGPSRTKNTTG